MSFKVKIAKKIPSRLLYSILLSVPFLYRTRFINFESYLSQYGIKELLEGLDSTKNLSGNIIECGSARCGTSIILARYLKSNNILKKIYALDSFSGFEQTELESERDLGLTYATADSFTLNSYTYVLKKIKKLKLDDTVIPIKGYFHQTLPRIDSTLCMGFIDCDLSESMSYCAETVWSKLVDGGILFFDDYKFKKYTGVKLAVDEFVRKNIHQIHQHGLLRRLYFVKKKC